MNCFKPEKTNAKAKAMSSKIQRFTTADYGVRDNDFFIPTDQLLLLILQRTN